MTGKRQDTRTGERDGEQLNGLNKQTRLKKLSREILIDAEGIDSLSALLVEALEQAGVTHKDVLRLRLAIEDVLLMWQAGAGENSVCTFRCGSRLHRMYIEIKLTGAKMDPAESGDEEGGTLLFSNILAQAGIAPVYSYRNGENKIAIYPPNPRKVSPIAQLVASIAAAVLCGIVFNVLPHQAGEVFASFVTPLFDTMMGLLQTLAGPMIFLSVCWGIVGIGDMQVLGKIGRTVLLRFLVSIFLVTALCALAISWMFDGANASSAAGSGAVMQIYSMVLGIIPSNIVSPFLEGNSLQIIFMAVCVGMVMLILGDKVSALRDVVDQINVLIQFLMEIVSRYLSLFVFVSLLSLFLSDAIYQIGGVAKAMIVSIVILIMCPLIYVLVVSIRMHVAAGIIVKKMLPTFLIALTTASSAAALSTNLETCKRQLGIPDKITGFAVPLGQVIYMPGASIGFIVLAFGLAECYGVAMPLSWVITAVLVSAMTAIAAPPIPGGGLACLTVMITQLGIPGEAIGIAIAANVIMEFFDTACSISCLQAELVLSADKLGMLKRDVLANAK